MAFDYEYKPVEIRYPTRSAQDLNSLIVVIFQRSNNGITDQVMIPVPKRTPSRDIIAVAQTVLWRIQTDTSQKIDWQNPGNDHLNELVNDALKAMGAR